MFYLNLLIALKLFVHSPNHTQAADCIVITSQRDTIVGTFVSADNMLTIKSLRYDRPLVFHPQQVHEYAITRPDGTQDYYQFVIKPSEKALKPMRRLVNGDLKLFELKEPQINAVNPALPKGSTKKPLQSVFYIGTYSEDVVQISMQNWKSLLKEWIPDCPLLLENLGKKGYHFNNLPGIIAAYNVCHQRSAVRN